MENLRHVPSGRQPLRTKRLIFLKCLIYRKLIVLDFLGWWGGWGGARSWLISSLGSFARGTIRRWLRSRWSCKVGGIYLKLCDLGWFCLLINCQGSWTDGCIQGRVSVSLGPREGGAQRTMAVCRKGTEAKCECRIWAVSIWHRLRFQIFCI